VLALSYVAGSRHRASQAKDGGKTAGTPSDGQHVELAISGMKCSRCAESVRRSLVECDGVAEADVDLRHGRAVIYGEHLDERRLVDAVAGLGYASHPVES